MTQKTCKLVLLPSLTGMDNKTSAFAFGSESCYFVLILHIKLLVLIIMLQRTYLERPCETEKVADRRRYVVRYIPVDDLDSQAGRAHSVDVFYRALLASGE